MAKHAMPDIVVLLPGITGSVLKKNGKVVWGFSASTIGKALFTLGRTMERDLALPHDDRAADDLGDGIVADALMPDLHLLPGVWKIDGYGKIAEAIKANFEVTEGRNFFPFPYDWRRDNRVSARRLARAAHDWLAAWRASSGNANAKLILVGHSMGGLVIRYFLECMEGWKETRALVTFGTPYRGSLNALDGLANGLKKGPLDLSRLARQLTALYHLLPVYECYDAGNGKLVRVGETQAFPTSTPRKRPMRSPSIARSRPRLRPTRSCRSTSQLAIAFTRSLASRRRPACLRVWPATRCRCFRPTRAKRSAAMARCRACRPFRSSSARILQARCMPAPSTDRCRTPMPWSPISPGCSRDSALTSEGSENPRCRSRWKWRMSTLRVSR